LEDQGKNGRIILKQTLKKKDGGVCSGFIWLTKGQVTGCCEHCDEPSASIKRREILDQMRNCYPFKKDYAECSPVLI
jgi:hypothetical protein